MGFFDVALESVANGFLLGTEIPLEDEAVVAATGDDTDHFLVEFKAGDGGGGFEDVDWLVWVVDIPDVSFIWHFIRHLLESLNSISNSHF